MKIYIKILMISIGLLLASLGVSAHTNPTKTVPPIAKLPMASVSPLTTLLPTYDWSKMSDDITSQPASGQPVLLNVPIVGGQYEFDALDLSLEDYMSTIHAEQSMMSPPDSSPFVDAMQAVVDQKDAIKKAKNIIDEAIVVGREIQSLIAGELVSLPIYMSQTIGNKDVTLVIQSATIFPKYAQLEVYMKIDLGKKDFFGKDAILYFGADKILFNSEQGIIYGSIGLLSDYAIKLDNSSKAGLVFRKMKKALKTGEGIAYDPDLPDSYDYSGTFANFDCNGFKELGIEGTFVMSRDWVIPTDDLGIPLATPKTTDISPVTPRVHATVSVIVQDWNDFLLTINLDPMVFANWQKAGFVLTNATLDMSSYRNAPNYVYTDPIEWEGVYIENISITLPTPFKKSCSSFANTSGEGEAGSSNPDSNNSSQTNPAANGETQNNIDFDPPELCRTRVSAQHLRIDKNGVSGLMSIDGQVPLVGGGVIGGQWGMSMDVIKIGLVNSKVVQFYVAGQLGVPILSKKTPLDYTVDFKFELDHYKFDVTIPTDKPIEIPIWNAANVSLTNPTVGAIITDDDFDMWVKFQTTKVQIGKASDYADSENGSIIKMPSLTLTDMRLATSAPYFTFSGVQVEGGESKVANFPVSVDNLSLATPDNDPETLVLGFDLIINLMESSTNSVTATGFMDLRGDYIRNIDGTRSWKYRSLNFNGADVTICVPQFYGKGKLRLLKNDPEYGTGFTAALVAGVVGDCGENPSVDDFKFQLSMTSIFGSKDTYRYFLVDGFVGGKAIKIPLFGPVYMDGFGGGLFHNMAPSEYIDGAGESFLGVDLSGIKYKPTTSTRLGIKFATSIATADKLLDGMLTCIIRFDQNMALQNITFWGVADIMIRTDVEEDITNAVDDLHDRLPTIVQTVSDIQEADKAKAKSAGTGEESNIKAKLGMSLDIAGGFSFHVYGEVTLLVQGQSGDPNKPLLKGTGQLDLLLDPDKNNWHFFLGGYYPNPQGIEILVPDFFNEDSFITLLPVGATLDYGGFTASAGFYFLAGNKIPGPPPPPSHVIAFFDGSDGVPDPDMQEFEEKGNRELLTCGGNDPALGTGMAFGAHAKIEFNAKIKGFLGSCAGGLRLSAIGGVGFDLAFLKYGNGTSCNLSGDSPQGLNGFRATGLAYAFVDIRGKHVTCFPIPPLGVGIKVKFDVPNPSFFDVKAVLKVGMKLSIRIGIGTECGTPCSTSVTLD